MSDLALQKISDDWLEILHTEELDQILDTISKFKSITPPISSIFNFARYTALDKIKVVILGQDPYPKAGDAHGLAFSCLTNVPASLNNIFKCLMYHKLIKSIPTSGDLIGWAEQGVLLLNCALTTQIGKSNAHVDYWSAYTDLLIKQISELANDKRPIIFMLWGNFAKKKRPLISDKCTILEWAHPSPLAQSTQSFMQCDHFTRTNKILSEHKIDPINWDLNNDMSEIEKEFTMHSGKTVVFTDGSAKPNKCCEEAIAGYAAIFALGVFEDVIIYGNIANRPHFASNQRAEGMAIFSALKYLKEHSTKWSDCIIVSDSEFWIKMFTQYMESWSSAGLDFNEKKNSDMTIPMWELYCELVNGHGKTIEFRHIRSHNKDHWNKEPETSYKYFCAEQNNYIDELAGYARATLTPGTEIIKKVKYDE